MRRRVVHVEAGRNLYGGALQVRYLLGGLAAAGWDTLLVCPEGSAIAEVSGDNARVMALPLRGDLDVSLFFHLRRILRAERPDLIHLHSRRGADFWGGLAGRSLGLPTLLTRRVDNPEPRWWVRRKYRLYDKVVTISEGIRQVLIEEGVPAGKVVTVRSAVDTQRYRPGGDRNWLLREFGLPEQALAIGMIAQFIPRKGHYDLLAAARRVVAESPLCRFVLFGKGPLEEEIKQAIHEQGLERCVLPCGFRTDLERIIPALDLVVHPAKMEGLGVSLLQAAACEVPIVATPVGGIPEIVRDGETGVLVPIGDVERLAAVLLELASDQTRRHRMGRAARERVLREFSIETMVAGNLAVYDELAGARS